MKTEENFTPARRYVGLNKCNQRERTSKVLLIVGWLAILLVIILITPKFGWSAAILLQKASVKIADIIKST